MSICISPFLTAVLLLIPFYRRKNTFASFASYFILCYTPFMKSYYKINEIAKLYGIGPDSLRYYEKLGILKPRRGANNYRLYSLKDLYKLNILRDLRGLGFSMEQIKDYLDGQSIDNTLGLLRREELLLRRRIDDLKAREQIIKNRISSLSTLRDSPDGTVFVESCPERYCVQVTEHITRDEEMDFLIKKLHKKHENIVQDLGTLTIGAFISVPDLKNGISNVYTSVFFVLGGIPAEYDFTLPAGSYLSCRYRGGYDDNVREVEKVLGHAREHGISTAGDPFEIYEIDNRDTIKPEEFLTKIQIAL